MTSPQRLPKHDGSTSIVLDQLSTRKLRGLQGKLWWCLQVLAIGLVVGSFCNVSAQEKSTSPAPSPTQNPPGAETKSEAGAKGQGGSEKAGEQKAGEQKTNSGGQASGERPGPPDLSTVKVRGVYGELALFRTITVNFKNLSTLLQAANNDYSKIILYVDGYPLKGITTRQGNQSTELRFDLARTTNDETKKSWNNLLGRPDLPIPQQREVSVTAALDGQRPLEIEYDAQTGADPAHYKMTIIRPYGYWVYIVVLLVFTIVFIRWARNSDVLRVGPRPTDGKLQRYSLGRVQMAFWFFIVAASYVFIWMVTSEYRVLPGSVLALIGISAATALGAATIDASGPGSVATSVTPQPTEGFFTDIFTDDQGKLTFHRFQIAVWSIVLAVIFIASVYHVLTMADFPNELLALMGISSGTYLGFKFPEKQETQNRAAAAGAPPQGNPSPKKDNPPQGNPNDPKV
jgi:hypothetical protein